MGLLGIVYFIFVLGIIVLVHELGHLIVAKRNGVYCHEFSIGMGPKITTIYKDKTGTIYNIRALPIGGYVQMAGEDTGDKKDENIEKEKKFDQKGKWIKFKILVAGASMNFVLGLVVFIILNFFAGSPILSTNKVTIEESYTDQIKTEDSVKFEKKEYPLYAAGMRSGDQIVSINGQKVEDYNQIIENISNSENIKITYISQSNNSEKTIDVKRAENGYLGISPNKEKYRFFNSIKYGFLNLINTIKNVFYSFYLLFTPEYSLKDGSGPIGIAVASNGVVQSGWENSLIWIAFLSINIGIINLLPIPALDGGRILFLLIELITKKPLNPKVETFLNNLVFFLLIGLLIFFTFNDIINFQKFSDFFKEVNS